MKKIDDWFYAGAVAGFYGGICHLLWNSAILLIGIQSSTFWLAMGGLFYNQQLLYTWPAQIHGVFDAIGVSVAGGILTSATFKFTGKDYLYIKSLILSAAGAYFLFIVVFPQTGLGKDSTITPWVAIFGFMVFNGLLEGYILQKIYSFKQSKN